MSAPSNAVSKPTMSAIQADRQARERQQRGEIERSLLTAGRVRVMACHEARAAVVLERFSDPALHRNGEFSVFNLAPASAISAALIIELTEAGISFDHWQGHHAYRWFAPQVFVRFDPEGVPRATVLGEHQNRIEHETVLGLLTTPDMTLEGAIRRIGAARSMARVPTWEYQKSNVEVFLGLRLLDEPGSRRPLFDTPLHELLHPIDPFSMPLDERIPF